MDPMGSAKRGEERLERIARRYGLAYARCEESLAARWGEADWEAAEANLESRLEALARLIGSRLEFGAERAGPSERERRARLCVGLSGAFGVELADPAGESGARLARAGAGASFDPETGAMRLLAEGEGAFSALGHEWAHALDAALGAEPGWRPREAGAQEEGSAGFERGLERIRAVFEGDSKAPLQEFAGELARMDADRMARSAPEGLSERALRPGGGWEEGEGWGRRSRRSRAAAGRIARRIGPADPKGMSQAEIGRQKGLLEEQAAWLERLAREMAREDLRGSADFGAELPARSRERLAGDLARIVAEEAKREASRRRGRETAFDRIKDRFALRLGEIGLSEEGARVASGSLMRIEALKRAVALEAREQDLDFDAPYTGRADWFAPASLHDIACALVRARRSAKALENPELSKERAAPMASWWASRGEVSKALLGKVPAGPNGLRSMPGLILRYALLLEAQAPGSQRKGKILRRGMEMMRWAEEKAEFAFGAALFSDLTGTGERLLKEEAKLGGKRLGDREAASLRKRIAAPSEYLGARRGAREVFAGGFERAVSLWARSRGEKGRAAREALELGLAEDVARGVRDEAAWMMGSPGRAQEEARDWGEALAGLWGVAQERDLAWRRERRQAEREGEARAEPGEKARRGGGPRR